MAYSPGSQQVGSIVRYTQQFQNTAEGGNTASELCVAVVVGAAGVGTTPYPVDLCVIASASGAGVNKIVKAVPYAASGSDAVGYYTPIVSASNFA